MSTIARTWADSEWLRHTLDAAGLPFVSLDTGGQVVVCNRHAEAAFGRTLSGLDFGEEVVAPRMRTAYRAALRRATERRTRSGRELRVELCALHHDGHEVPVELAMVGVQVEGTTMINVFARVLTEHPERLSPILEVAADAIITTDRRGIVTGWNPAAVRLTGHPADEALGRPLDVLLRAEAEDDQRRISQAAAAGRSAELTGVAHMLRDGRSLRIDITTSPLSDTRGRVIGAATVARPAIAAVEHERRAWERRIRDVCTTPAGLRIALQPVVDLETGVVRGYEALARFTVPPPSPDEWFTAATDVGLDAQLEARAIAAALARRRELGGGAIGVNVSPQALMTDEVQAAFRGAGELDDVIVEITEQSAVSDYATLRAALDELRDRGARVAVDDTGAGYACLRHVLSIAPEFVKIDRSLICGVDADPARSAVIETLAALAGRIDALLVAEGVETEGELAALLRLGIPLAQGYLFAPPGPEPVGIAPGALAVLRARGRVPAAV